MIYSPEFGIYDPYDYETEDILPDSDEYYGYISDETFHIEYNDKPLKTLICLKCNGKDFNLGHGSYYTVAKCTTCLWEVCVHSG